MKFLLSFILFYSLLLVPSSEAAFVLANKNKQVLIQLEGLKTKKGAYFIVADLYGKLRGLVQIKRVGQTKAIGVLRRGHIATRWSLEPTSKTRAVAIQKRSKRRAAIAYLQKERARQKLARQKLVKRRSIASYENQGEYILEDMPEESDYQSQDILNEDNNLEKYGSSEAIYDNRNFHSNEDYKNQNSSFENPISSKKLKRFTIGFAPRVEYNFMYINPEESGIPSYLMDGLGYSAFLFVDFSLNHFLRAEGSVGFKQFSVATDGQSCGNRENCYLKMNYIGSALNLKINVIEFYSHKFWLAAEGSLMFVLQYSNKASLDKDSFYPFHGSLGGALGLDFSIGNFVVPISLRSGLYNPTATTITGSVGAQMGLAYKF